MELPESDTEVTKGEAFGSVESVKAASDVYSPVSGVVVEANSELSTEPGILNAEPFEKGWMLKVSTMANVPIGNRPFILIKRANFRLILLQVKVSDKSGLDDLMTSADYSKFCESGDN